MLGKNSGLTDTSGRATWGRISPPGSVAPLRAPRRAGAEVTSTTERVPQGGGRMTLTTPAPGLSSRAYASDQKPPGDEGNEPHTKERGRGWSRHCCGGDRVSVIDPGLRRDGE